VRHVDDEDEGRPTVFARQRLRIGLGLGFRRGHHRVPAAAGARSASGAGGGGVQRETELRGFAGARILLPLAALLAFENKAAAFIEIDAAERLAAVVMPEEHVALEDVSIVGFVFAGGLGTRHIQRVAQLAHERLEIRTLRRAGFFPARDETVHAVGGGHRANRKLRRSV
jgi:hypothetical protein